MSFLQLIFVLNSSLVYAHYCGGQFPIRESVEIVKRLVAAYAVPVVRRDRNGTEWMNNLFIKNDGLEMDGVQYFLNDNRLPPEMTFFFADSLLLDSTPIFVVDREQINSWRPDFPDKTKALTKISRRCDIGQRACGLKCCKEENHIVQKGFLDYGSLAESNYTFNGVTYRLRDNYDNSTAQTCSYFLSYYDPLFSQASGKQVSSIYFSCPRRSSCCGLTCEPHPSTALLRKPREANLLSLEFDKYQLNALLTAGTIVSLIAFVAITLINRR
ncbi:unnamed protein product [Nippostrongylus brasiliensis]|uniref:CX domain-containing protein n=1 Tax=Nippostrongylus brasiliensis TaxID=27835 RepID=A0A158R033_NIPBR|nr:unnamed protein product [Nippostrongylus brasiliensis]